MQKRLGYNGSYEIKQHPWLQDVDWEVVQAKQLPVPKYSQKKLKDKRHRINMHELVISYRPSEFGRGSSTHDEQSEV